MFIKALSANTYVTIHTYMVDIVQIRNLYDRQIYLCVDKYRSTNILILI